MFRAAVSVFFLIMYWCILHWAFEEWAHHLSCPVQIRTRNLEHSNEHTSLSIEWKCSKEPLPGGSYDLSKEAVLQDVIWPSMSTPTPHNAHSSWNALAFCFCTYTSDPVVLFNRLSATMFALGKKMNYWYPISVVLSKNRQVPFQRSWKRRESTYRYVNMRFIAVHTSAYPSRVRKFWAIYI